MEQPQPPHNSAVIVARCDIRLVATLARYFDQELDQSPQKTLFTKSGLIRESLELARKAVDAPLIETAEEAYGVMRELGYPPDKRGKGNLRKQMVEEMETYGH